MSLYLPNAPSACSHVCVPEGLRACEAGGVCGGCGGPGHRTLGGQQAQTSSTYGWSVASPVMPMPVSSPGRTDSGPATRMSTGVSSPGTVTVTFASWP